LALWWVGLGIEPVWNHPHTPKENAFVERFNGLVDTWGEPGQCADLAHFQERMTWVTTMQREVYPSVKGRTRLESYPALRACPRAYVAAEEPRVFAITLVKAYLSSGQWRRLVGKTGQITLYNRAYSVGRVHAGTHVYVRFDAQACAWVIQNREGQELKRHPAEQITQERICRLEVCHIKPSRKSSEQQNFVAQQ
jgi:hypothetical protein